MYILPETTSFSVRYTGSAGIGAHYVYPSSGREILSRLDFHGAALIPCLRSPYGTLIIMDPACCTRTYFYRDWKRTLFEYYTHCYDFLSFFFLIPWIFITLLVCSLLRRWLFVTVLLCLGTPWARTEQADLYVTANDPPPLMILQDSHYRTFVSRLLSKQKVFKYRPFALLDQVIHFR